MPFDAHATSFSAGNARILGQAAAMAYEDPPACERWAVKQGFTPGTLEFFDAHDTQGFVVENDEAIVVAFRGTQPRHPVDWLSDGRVVQATWAHTVGKVHKGFYEALRAVWGDGQVLPRRLVGRGNRTVWITGHSLGGALAELCAARACFDPAITSVPIQGIYTFGQPRVGDEAFAALLHQKLGARTFRFVNDRDIVPRVPFFSMGYRHYGNQTFFDKVGKAADTISTVETLAAALTFAKGALSAEGLAEVAGLFVDLVHGATHGVHLQAQEEAARARVNAILQSGIENVSDHDMRKCYLERIKAPLDPA
ncbi:MAG TPA: lipase family protein [Vicinamibacterales bacterium]|nr:lipase family protein [Vicinamibacterales bacterium]